MSRHTLASLRFVKRRCCIPILHTCECTRDLMKSMSSVCNSFTCLLQYTLQQRNSQKALSKRPMLLDLHPGAEFEEPGRVSSLKSLYVTSVLTDPVAVAPHGHTARTFSLGFQIKISAERCCNIARSVSSGSQVSKECPPMLMSTSNQL